jgi:large subunit ribosomal protein L17
LGDKEAVKILFEEIAPRFADRNGGYTRILRLADRRLGDAGEKAILEFVGRNDRVAVRSERPAFDQDEEQAADETQTAAAPPAEPAAGEGQQPAGGESRSET